jgi:hypothetical protein
MLYCTSQMLGGQPWDRRQAYVVGGLSYCIPQIVITLKYWTFLLFKYIIELAVLKMYCKSAIFGFWKRTATFWELRTALTMEMYKTMCYPVFLYRYWWVGWKGTCWEILHRLNVKSEYTNMNDLQAFKLSRQLNCDIYQGMWTFAVTHHGDCIRLLADRGMNICHEVWSLSTVMQPVQCTANRGSCCSQVAGNLR